MAYIYQSPTSPFYFVLLHSRGGGHGPLSPLAMPVPVVQPGFINLGSKRGSKATERGEGVGGGFLPDREIFLLKFRV